MKLLEFKYETTNANSMGYNNWYLESLSLNKINLIVGKNSVGKSRTVQLVSSFAKMITEQVPFVFFGKWNLKFENNDGIIVEYELNASNEVKAEMLSVNNSIVLNRNKNTTEIFSYTLEKFIKINPPSDKLVIHIRRDIVEFPFFEDIAQWAKQVHGFKFGNISPNALIIDKKADRLTSVDEIPILLESLDKNHYESIIENFNSLGYNLENISLKKDEGGAKIVVFEKGLKLGINQPQLSQGMFRSLSILIFIEYLIVTKKVSTLIIDDLCEGLDYERAVKLGKLIIEKIENSNIQLIATSNDSFLMDVIPIKYWNILHREGNTVKSYNYQNSKEIFDKFKMSGLSNFDLFSSDYLLQKQ